MCISTFKLQWQQEGSNKLKSIYTLVMVCGHSFFMSCHENKWTIWTVVEGSNEKTLQEFTKNFNLPGVLGIKDYKLREFLCYIEAFDMATYKFKMLPTRRWLNVHTCLRRLIIEWFHMHQLTSIYGCIFLVISTNCWNQLDCAANNHLIFIFIFISRGSYRAYFSNFYKMVGISLIVSDYEVS